METRGAFELDQTTWSLFHLSITKHIVWYDMRVFFVVYIILPDIVMFPIYYLYLKFVARISSCLQADIIV